MEDEGGDKPMEPNEATIWDAAVEERLTAALVAALPGLTETERERIAAGASRVRSVESAEGTATFTLELDGVEIARVTLKSPPSLPDA